MTLWGLFQPYFAVMVKGRWEGAEVLRLQPPPSLWYPEYWEPHCFCPSHITGSASCKNRGRSDRAATLPRFPRHNSMWRVCGRRGSRSSRGHSTNVPGQGNMTFLPHATCAVLECPAAIAVAGEKPLQIRPPQVDQGTENASPPCCFQAYIGLMMKQGWGTLTSQRTEENSKGLGTVLGR